VDNPTCIEIDPNNGQHLYTCQAGWCGDWHTGGFWESTDGGKNWQAPAGFIDILKQPNSSNDIGRFTVDPGNFKHIVLSMRNRPNAQTAFMESTDGGLTFSFVTVSFSIPLNTNGINFLHDLKHNQGDGNTWITSEDAQGFWRTSDDGKTWTNVCPTCSGVHGGVNEIYYAKSGMLYYPGYPNPYRSSDNGVTWQAITDKMFGQYTSFCGDGDSLYTGVGSYMETSSESDGLHWSSVQSTATPFSMMKYDGALHIIVGTDLNNNGKIWALNTGTTSTGTQKSIGNARRFAPAAGVTARIVNNRLLIQQPGTAASIDRFFDVNGQRVLKAR
jgi:hypothetical protein